MERTRNNTELRVEGADGMQQGENETGARDVRRLVELELMLVGGGGDNPDWGG